MTNQTPLFLYSPRQIVVTTTLAGPLMGGYMLQRNFKNMDRHRASVITSVLSYALQALTYLVFLVTTEVVVIRSGLYNYSPVLGYVGVVGVLLVLQLLNSGLILLTRRTMAIAPSKSQFRTYSVWNLLLTVIAGLVISFFLVRSGPFWFRFLAVYFLASFYLFHRLAKPFGREWQRLLIMGMGFILTCIYPTVDELDRYIHTQSFPSLHLFSYNYLAFFLYFLLLFIVVDVVLTLLDRTLFRHLDKSRLNTSRIVLSLVLTLLVSGIVARGIHQFNTPKVNAYAITLPAKTSPLKELKIVLAADLHISELTTRDFMHQFVETINTLEADIVLMPGDLVESSAENENMTYMRQQLANITSKYGTFAVLGNHDYGNLERKKAFIEGANMRLLHDTSLVIDEAFVLIGRQDRRRSRKPLMTILESAPGELLAYDGSPATSYAGNCRCRH